MASTELKAILEIANSSQQLRHDLLPLIDQAKEEVNWEKLGSGLSGGTATAAAWMKAIWTSENELLNNFGSLDQTVQRAILRAMTVRYGL